MASLNARVNTLLNTADSVKERSRLIAVFKAAIAELLVEAEEGDIFLDSKGGKVYGSWGSPITDEVVVIDMTGALVGGKAFLYGSFDGSGLPYFTGTGFSVIENGVTFASVTADEVTLFEITYMGSNLVSVGVVELEGSIVATAPSISTATVENAEPSDIVITWDIDTMVNTELVGWVYTIDGGADLVPTAVVHDEATKVTTLTTIDPVANGEVVVLDYDPTAFVDQTGRVRSARNYYTAAIVAQAVTNNVV